MVKNSRFGTASDSECCGVSVASVTRPACAGDACMSVQLQFPQAVIKFLRAWRGEFLTGHFELFYPAHTLFYPIQLDLACLFASGNRNTCTFQKSDHNAMVVVYSYLQVTTLRRRTERTAKQPVCRIPARSKTGLYRWLTRTFTGLPASHRQGKMVHSIFCVVT